jgi:magnesium-transporting ATPase (P-type)
MSLAGIVACQIGNGLACRSEHDSILKLGPLSNRVLLWAMLAEIVLLLLLIYTPLAYVFHLAPLQPALAAAGGVWANTAHPERSTEITEFPVFPLA